MKYEQPFDYLFDTQGQAFEALETYDAKVEAEQSGWVYARSPYLQYTNFMEVSNDTRAT